MQTNELLRQYATFNIWANQKMFDWLKDQPETLLETEVSSSFSSLKKTVLHIWDAEDAWFFRLNGQAVPGFPSQDFSGTTADGFHRLLAISTNILSLISKKSEEWFDEDFSYHSFAGLLFSNPRRDSIHHVLNHSTYHRGQLVTIGRSLGLTDPPSTDFIAWKRTL